ncbi:hypothetical protein N7456_010781 [Penicillium angulare]|uniref:FAD-binding domain-containing protein n=1 Tax=Penicillium angulare TaxID=116970 RepID=A0A9W9JZG0_9EURO|nr:hypothetical protein N7456_010781 [Penicillium angulare]
MVINYFGYRDDPRLQAPSYPSHCLHFLRQLGRGSSPEPTPASAWNPLDIHIVGAGIAGLAAAISLARQNHSVTIHEQAHALPDDDTGIQLPPNAARLLLKMGLGSYLEKYVTEQENVFLRRWKDGNVIGRTKFGYDFRQKFDAPYWVIHRAHFHQAMQDMAGDLGVVIEMDSKVVSYNTEAPNLTLANGTVVKADLIIAADGVNSSARKLVPKALESTPHITGFASYRAEINMERMKEDPELAELLEKSSLNLWLGDNRHVQTYKIDSGKTFIMVMCYPDNDAGMEYGEVDPTSALLHMREEFKDWDPVLTKIINMVEHTQKWPMYSGSRLKRWVSGKFLVLGDAAHTMLPYMSQGPAIAVEDAVALAHSLGRITAKSQISLALSVFEKVRVERANQMQEASLLNGKIWHFPDGPLQKARDLAMMPEVKGQPFSHSPNQWSDPSTQMWCYGYNTEREIDLEWSRYRV